MTQSEQLQVVNEELIRLHEELGRGHSRLEWVQGQIEALHKILVINVFNLAEEDISGTSDGRGGGSSDGSSA